MDADRFDLDALLVTAAVAPRELVKTLMEIAWADDVAAKIAQIDARLAAIADVEATARQRIIDNPALAGKPLPPVPPPAVMHEFAVVMATKTASDRLRATRAALAPRLDRR